MKLLTKAFFAATLFCCTATQVFSQTDANDNLPKDYLTKEFHAGRRDALRKLMPENSVVIIFAYPDRVFSKDVSYVYHANPDLYYFSGYNEPNAVLLIFKDKQADGSNELFYVQHRDPTQEQWTGKRLGVEGVKSKLGFSNVYNSEDFVKSAIDFKKFSQVIYDEIPDDISGNEPGSLKELIDAFKLKASIKTTDKFLSSDLNLIALRATPSNLDKVLAYLKPKLDLPAYKANRIIEQLISKPDSVTLADVKKQIGNEYSATANFENFTTELRGVKTAEELVLLKKSVVLSSLAHAEAMRAVTPTTSERQLEGIMLYVHKYYGAEDEGYGPIVGSGGNGCILHYEENSATEVKNQLVLMDVGAMYHGYSADVTRTFPANGKFTEAQKAIYQLVYDAQEAVFPLCKEGVPYRSLEVKTREVLAAGLIKLGLMKDAKDLGKYYPHGVSHHLGLDVHDKGSRDNLKAGMVITVEPGIYIPEGSPCDKKWWDIGVRIEDDILIGKDGGTNLSVDAPRKWQDVEKMIAEKSLFDAGKLPVLK
jgi:Xaa-Pro aminopeptidase